jgi:hypothetical protein
MEPVSLLLLSDLFDNTEREEYEMTKDTHAQTRATPGAGNKKPESDMRNNNIFALVDATTKKWRHSALHLHYLEIVHC